MENKYIKKSLKKGGGNSVPRASVFKTYKKYLNKGKQSSKLDNNYNLQSLTEVTTSNS